MLTLDYQNTVHVSAVEESDMSAVVAECVAADCGGQRERLVNDRDASNVVPDSGELNSQK